MVKGTKNFGRTKKGTNIHLCRQKRSCDEQQPQPLPQQTPSTAGLVDKDTDSPSHDELNESDHEIVGDTDDYFILMNFSILKAVIDEVVKSSICTEQSLNR